MQNITKEQQALLNLLANNIFGCTKNLPKNINYEELLIESKCQAVTAIVYNDKKILQHSDSNLIFKHIAVNSHVFANHTLLHNIMTDGGIPYTVLKGAASAYYYPEPMLRTMGDVDFLVKKEDVERATELLIQNGFTPWEEEHICHIVFRKDSIHLEMHFEPAGVPNGKAGEIAREYIKDIIECSTLTKNKPCTFVNPDKFHHGFIMLLHMQHHLLSEGIGLRHLCDWAVFVNSFKNNEFEKIFKEKLKNIGLWKFAKIISLTAHIAIGLPYQNFMGKSKNFATALLEDILSGGNFGIKDNKRTSQGMFISNRGKDGVRHSMFVQFILSLNEIVYSKWKISKKCKILLPFGWIFFCFRRIFRESIGKREKTEIKQLYKNSKNRKELYKRFHLFETE